MFLFNNNMLPSNNKYDLQFITRKYAKPESKPEAKPESKPETLPLQQHYTLPINEKNIYSRNVIQNNNNIDLYNNLNDTNITVSKTIVHLLDHSSGFGDFLRGSIVLAEYAKYYNIYFKINISNHELREYLEIEGDNTVTYPTDNIHNICFNGGKSDKLLNPLLINFMKSDDTIIYIKTNMFYNINLVSSDIKHYINSYFTFKPKYYDMVKQLFPLDKYKVLHIRCHDNYFDKEFDDNNLIIEIIKLQLNQDTIVISNNYSIKRKINKMFGFHFIDGKAVHTGNTTHYSDFESTVIEYIILSKSYYTHCFSYYMHGSGFSEQCSVLNNVPYTVVYLPDINVIHNDIKLLTNHYTNLLEDHFIDNKQIINQPTINIDHSNIAFITLTNNGYIDYTLNCIESMRRIHMKQMHKVYCIGKYGCEILKQNNILCELIDNETYTNFQEFRKKDWSNITYYKFEIIYNNLLNHDFVCITDGDIVYENNTMFDYLLNNIGDNDMLCQSEGIYNNDLCSGFMFVKSNELTISLFNPKNVEKYRNTVGWGDQIYVNLIKYNIKYKKLPLSLFPTGQYYYTYSSNLKPYLIHFNWIVGHEKKNKMIKYNKWYVEPKIRIIQYGTDGFGHQMEGMLRLLSLSINNKAIYQYNYNKIYQYEHNNFDIEELKKYCVKALNYLSNDDEIENTIDVDENIYSIKMKENRTFDEIKANDENWKNTIYFYDGVSSKDPKKLPPNFESNTDFEQSLPKLREAFVLQNNFLPKPSFDNNYINVCAHIRLGDAVGQRILDNEKIFEVIRLFQKHNKYRVIIHTDGDVYKLANINTIIYDSKTDVLQVLSDFIFADILLINFSSLSIAAHLLGNNNQTVICPEKAGPTFKNRILNKCIPINDFIERYLN